MHPLTHAQIALTLTSRYFENYSIFIIIQLLNFDDQINFIDVFLFLYIVLEVEILRVTSRKKSRDTSIHRDATEGILILSNRTSRLTDLSWY